MLQYFNDISVLPRSNYETEDIYKIKGQILEMKCYTNVVTVVANKI